MKANAGQNRKKTTPATSSPGANPEFSAVMARFAGRPEWASVPVGFTSWVDLADEAFEFVKGGA